MFRTRRIFDDTIPIDRTAIGEVQEILRSQFTALGIEDIAKLPGLLRNPMKYRFRTVLFVSDSNHGRVRGFALMQHEPQMGFCYLDYLSVHPRESSRGIGGALYERVREEGRHLGAAALFFECLPDDPALCREKELLPQNRARLRFYERYGALPVINTKYETPFKPDGDCPPYLMFDPLRRGTALSRDFARAAVEAILERKYGDSCPPGYIAMVIDSFREDPVRLRPPKHLKAEADTAVRSTCSMEKRIALVVSDGHSIHHVKDRGYVESPARLKSILGGLGPLPMFDTITPHPFPERHIREVHDRGFYEYLKRMCLRLEPGNSVYPYVFPIRNATRPPVEMPLRAGYYCIDTFTPLNRNAFPAARGAVNCALTAARSLLQGYRMAYALVRPPGHHAERRVFGGFCYLNSTAVAAQYLSHVGRVAVLDIDYHHGNGTQDIFYARSDVMTLSIHGHPRFAYPYFSGFSDETGTGEGAGYNVNLPLEEHVDGERYRRVLQQALQRITRFSPDFLVVALGFDTAKGDPTGTWSLQPGDFEKNGTLMGLLGRPTLFVQEGGYRIPTLGKNAASFFRGFMHGMAPC
ncbi:MAG: histone deacetylase family protein [Spirochaetes bacterium]|nr:histone deacetylase family protein [Spirochaetota bacterium]